MRLLHTSDWHLGRTLHREDLLPAQQAFLTHLVAVAKAERADAVLVAGDVYDRAVPSLGAVGLFDAVLHELAALDVPVVLISGNHDSARRLGVGAGLLARAQVHLRTDPDECATPVLLADEHGPVAVYGIPYLEPALHRERFGAEAARHGAVLGAAMDRIRADLASRPEGTRSVVLAHAFVTGGRASDSERDITVGGVPSAPASVFAGVDYVALGHLHRAQVLADPVAVPSSGDGAPEAKGMPDAGGAPEAEGVPGADGVPEAGGAPETEGVPEAGTEPKRTGSEAAAGGAAGAANVGRLRYSGSPLAYSFSEAGQAKGMWLVDLGPAGEVTARQIACPQPRPLARLRGRLDEVLADPAHAWAESAWVEVTLTDPGRPERAMERLRERFPHTLHLVFEPEETAADGHASYRERLGGRSDAEVALGFVAHVRGTEPSADEALLLREALEQAARERDPEEAVR